MPPEVTTYRALQVSMLAVALVVAGCGGSSAHRGAPARTDGPVAFAGAAHEQRASMQAREGEQVVFGANTVENRGHATARFSGARLVGDIDPSVAALSAVRIVDLGKAPGSGTLLGASKWPDRAWKDWWDSATPVVGAKLAPGDAAEVVFVLDVKRTGDWIWPETAVDYEIGGSRYTAITDFGFQICPPAPDRCRELTSGGD